MNKRLLVITVTVAIAALFITAGIYAGTEYEDMIKLENPAYKKREYKTVTLSHRKHVEEYKASCGECHHDKDNKPLDLKEGDDVQVCIECHKKPEYIKGKKAKGLTKEQKREYHANAFHDNCKGCHKKFNKEKGLKSKDKGYAPNTCKTCHGGKIK